MMCDADGHCGVNCRGFGTCTDEEAMATGLAEASFSCNEAGVEVEPIKGLPSPCGSADVMM